MQTSFGFDRVLQNITKVKQQLPTLLANKTQRYFFDSWDKQGFDGHAWETPKRKIPGTSEYKYPKSKDLGRRTRATLVKSGALRRAVGQSIREVSFEQIRLIVALPYAAVHNYGNEDKNIPQRQFIGQTQELTKEQIQLISNNVDFIWQA